MEINAVVNAGKDIVSISIPSESILFTIKSLAIFNKGATHVLSLGEMTEEELRSSILELILTLDEVNYKKFILLHDSLKSYRPDNVKRLAEEDREKGTDNIWKLVSRDFSFIYPFSPEGLSAKAAMLTLHYYCRVNAARTIRPGFFGRLAGRFDSYSYDINIEGYETARDFERVEFEKTIAELCRREYKYVKAVKVNGRSLL